MASSNTPAIMTAVDAHLIHIPVLPNQQPNVGQSDDWNLEAPAAQKRLRMARMVYDMWHASYQYDHTFIVAGNDQSNGYGNDTNGCMDGDVVWHMARYYYNGSLILIIDTNTREAGPMATITSVHSMSQRSTYLATAPTCVHVMSSQ